MTTPRSGNAGCPDCGTELTSVNGRLQGSRNWWCWKCEAHKRGPSKPTAALYHSPDPATGGLPKETP